MVLVAPLEETKVTLMLLLPTTRLSVSNWNRDTEEAVFQLEKKTLTQCMNNTFCIQRIILSVYGAL